MFACFPVIIPYRCHQKTGGPQTLQQILSKHFSLDFRQYTSEGSSELQLHNQVLREQVSKQNLGAANQLFVPQHLASWVHGANAVTFPMRNKVLTNPDTKNVSTLCPAL